MARAEENFRASFERLKQGKLCRLDSGSPVSQNNVAKEAGLDPSALRKARFPSLVAEIQKWVTEHCTDAPISLHGATLAARKRNRSLRDRLRAIKTQRDHAFSLLVESDAKILELAFENEELRAKLPPSSVSPFRSDSSNRSHT